MSAALMNFLGISATLKSSLAIKGKSFYPDWKKTLHFLAFQIFSNRNKPVTCSFSE